MEASLSISADFAFKYLIAALPTKTSIRLVPAAIAPSETIFTSLRSLSSLAWVPAQNSFEMQSLSLTIETTLTSSPYFSPNNAVAPVSLASSIPITFVSTLYPSPIHLFIRFSVFAISSGVIAREKVKSNLILSSST